MSYMVILHIQINKAQVQECYIPITYRAFKLNKISPHTFNLLLLAEIHK